MKNRDNFANYIEKKVLSFIRQWDMLCPGDKVVLGVSGGADSVCLLAVMEALQTELQTELCVVHINHGVRAEAGQDAAYVEQLCLERSLPFYLKEIRMEELAKQWKCSSEEAGRRARYAFFEEVCHATGSEKIAVAHNMGDCSETMLFHLFRGSGLIGLSGIRPVRDNIIRPILCLERREIEQYLSVKGLAYRHDITNDGDDYTRNRIRHHILPYAEEEIVCGATRNVYEAAKHLALVQDYIGQQVENAWEEVNIPAGEGRLALSLPKLAGLHEIVQKELLKKAVLQLTGSSKDITREHIDSLFELIGRSGNRRIQLPGFLWGERSYERLLLYVERACGEPWHEIPVTGEALMAGAVRMAFEDVEIAMEILEFSGNFQDIPQNKYTKWLDYDKIKGDINVRHRRNGDYFTVKTPQGAGRKKLKDYLIDEKLPREERDTLLLLAEGSHVLWLVPYRISEYYKVSEDTVRVLQITVKEQYGGDYGETQN